MIPRVARLGTGFHGAGQYYLNDVQKSVDATDAARPTAGDYVLQDKSALTANRVGFTATRSLPTTDPHKALRCMSWLAANAQNVRQAAVAAAAKAAGMNYADYVRKENPYRGRKGSKPVYTLSLAWHPTKDRTPAPADMLRAADEVLRALGLQDHQALIVQHTDTKHPHVHLIINRVSPINGKYASVSNDYLKLSWWALQHEKRTGFVLCHERVFNWQKRHGERKWKEDQRRTNPKAKGRYVRYKQTPRADHDWFKQHAHLSAEEIRDARATKQRKEAATFAVKQSAALLRFDQRLSKTIGREQDALAKERKRIEQKLDLQVAKTQPRTPLAIFRKAAAALSPTRLLKKRAVTRLAISEASLSALMDARRATKRDHLGQLWKRMERRHSAERRRDDERIAQRKRQGRSESAARRAKHAFRIRGGSHKLAQQKDTTFHEAVAPKQAGSLNPPEQREPLPIESQKQASYQPVKKSESRISSGDDERKERIAKRVFELERHEKKRRKRKRPRGKSRRRE